LTLAQVLRYLLRSPEKLRQWITQTTAQFSQELPDYQWNVVQTESFCLGHNRVRLR